MIAQTYDGWRKQYVTRNGKSGKDFHWPTVAWLGGGLAESHYIRNLLNDWKICSIAIYRSYDSKRR